MLSRMIGQIFTKKTIRHIFALHIAVLAIEASAQEPWYPSKYGKDDNIGAANNLSVDAVVAAANLVDQGKVYSLAIKTDELTPDKWDRFYQVKAYPMHGTMLGRNKISTNESLIIVHDGLGTSMDGFSHLGINQRYYNGALHEDIFPDSGGGVRRFGMDNVPPIVGRGVLLNMVSYYKGRDKTLSVGTEFNSAEIIGAANKQGLEIRKGDIVIFHTGWLPLLWEDPETYLYKQPGLGVDGASYLVNKDVTMVGIDARTMEAFPATYEEIAPVHQELLTKNGVYIFEHVDTRELVKNNVDEFLFVLGVPKLSGTVQGIINPIAIK